MVPLVPAMLHYMEGKDPHRFVHFVRKGAECTLGVIHTQLGWVSNTKNKFM